MIHQATTCANPYIEQIRQQVAACQDVKIDWLVVAHHDARMLEQLGKAFPKNALAVIALPQECWDMGEETLKDVVQWAVNELQVKGLLLVGHSKAGSPSGRVQLLGGPALAQSDREVEALAAPNSLIERVRQAQSLVESCEAHIAEQLEKLSTHSAVEHRLMRKQLQLHGLFYRAESGVFCVYDNRSQSFRALIKKTAVA